MGYLKPWRRRIGVVTLLMACVFAVGWVRSLTFSNTIEYHAKSNRATVEFVSSRGFIGLIYLTPGYFSGPLLSHYSHPNGSDYGDPLQKYDVNWQIRFCQIPLGLGHAFRPQTSDLFKFTGIAVPYWSIVLPMTLLSAYLLLSKR